MSNALTKVLFNEQGEINQDIIPTLIPKYEEMDEDEIEEFIYDLVSSTKLDSDFIAKHLDKLNMQELLVNNDVEESLLRGCVLQLIGLFMTELFTEDDTTSLDAILNKGYSEDFYEVLLSIFLSYYKEIPKQASAKTMMQAHINHACDKVSKGFIRRSAVAGDQCYMLMTVAMRRGDFSFEELKLVIDWIEPADLGAYLEAFEELGVGENGAKIYDMEGNGIFTIDNEILCKKIVVEKYSRELEVLKEHLASGVINYRVPGEDDDEDDMDHHHHDHHHDHDHGHLHLVPDLHGKH